MKKSNSISEDILGMDDREAKFRKMAQRRQSAPSIAIRGVLGRSNRLPASLYNKDDTCVPLSPISTSQRLSLKFGSHGAMLNLSKRQYVMEGKVQLTTGMQTQDRYMFLFTDLLLIAKAKSGSNYKLKYRIRVCELWIATCLDDVCELTRSPDKSFVLGWPTANCVATFSSPESKELWISALAKKIHDEKEKESPKTTTLKIISRDSNNTSHVRLVTVTQTHTARDVVRLAMKEFNSQENEDDYKLWVISRKEGTAYPLIGHEIPHAIHISHVRDSIAANGVLPEMDVTSISERELHSQPDIQNRCQFVLRSNHQSASKIHLDQTQRRLARIKNKTPASFFNWARKRHANGSNAQRQDSSDSGLASMSGNSGTDGSSFSSSPPSASSPLTPKLFSLPLAEICGNGEIPPPITAMLNVLYRKAPYTTGIFRKSANARTTRLLKEKLNDDVEVDMEDESIHVIAALFKDFLRNIPNSVLNCVLYPEWTRAIDQSDDVSKMTSLRDLLLTLEDVNRALVRRLAIVLSRIASHSKRNNMTSFNLSVCIAPSLLWPPASAGPFTQADATRKVTEILQFMVDRCNDIFDGIVLSDLEWPPEMDPDSDEEENDEFEGAIKPTDVMNELPSPVAHVAEEEADEKESVETLDDEIDDESDVNYFNRSRVMRRQLQRRRPQSKGDATRMERLSQDSLDNELNEESMLGSELTTEHQRMHRTGLHRGGVTDACSVSNDSGFTTLSGEDEDISSSGATTWKRIDNISNKQNPELLMSSSMGSYLYGMTSDNLDEAVSRGLRDLWDPSRLVTFNGEIVDAKSDDGRLEPVDVDVGDRDVKAGTDRKRDFAKETQVLRRRRSEPETADGLHRSSSGTNTLGKVTEPSSRLVAAITTPSVEYAGNVVGDAENEEEGDDMGLTLSMIRRQRPTYMRLNDAEDPKTLFTTKTNSNDDHVLAKEYLRKLRSQSAGEVLQALSSLEVKSLEKNHAKSISESLPVSPEVQNEPEVRRPFTLSLVTNDLSQSEVPRRDLAPEVVTIPAVPACSATVTSPIVTSSSPVLNTTLCETPLNRKYSSLRTHKDRKRELNKSQSHGGGLGGDTKAQSAGLIAIQKLTENLQSLPDFRRQSKTTLHSGDREKELFANRRTSSSVRANRTHRQSRGLQTHYLKSKKPLKGCDAVIGTSFKAIPRVESYSPVRNRDTSPPESDTIVTSRRRRSRTHNSSGLKSASASMLGGHDPFSKSLPSGVWGQRYNDTTSERAEPEVTPVMSGKEKETSLPPECDLNASETARKRRGSRQRHADPSTGNEQRSPATLPVAPSLVGMKVRDFSKSFSSPPARLCDATTPSPAVELSAVNVKSKINAFNHLIRSKDARSLSPSSSPSSTSSTSLHRSSNDVALTSDMHDPKPTFINLDTMLTDFKPGKLIPPVGAKHSTRRILNDAHQNRNDDNVKITDGRNGLILRISTPVPPPELIDSGSENTKIDGKSACALDSVSVSRTTRPSPLSDDMLFNLTDSFAFGNRKSPRSLTPSGTPHDSPACMRRRATEPIANVQSTAERKMRHKNVENRYSEKARSSRKDTETTTDNQNSVTHVHTHKHTHHKREDSGPNSHQKSASCRGKDHNGNSSFPGFEKVIYSEESYV